MSYQTGSATDLADLMTKLDTFAVANGWTSDQLDLVTGKAALSKGTIFVQFRWDVATPEVLSVYQSLAFDGTGTDPGAHTDDSGNGYNGPSAWSDSVADDERSVRDMGDGPFASYHFFESDTYIHVVAEISADVFRHFGFGALVKVGTWTGGEYAYAQNHTVNNLTSNANHNLLDGLFAGGALTRAASTLHMEGLPGMGGSEKWGQVWGTAVSTPPTDTAGNGKVYVQGGYKSGPTAQGNGYVFADSATGLVPMYSIDCWYVDTPNSNVYFLGTMPDVRGINIRYFAAGEEITIGSDTWVLFPDSQKTEDNVTPRSYNRGIAYKKITT